MTGPATITAADIRPGDVLVVNMGSGVVSAAVMIWGDPDMHLRIEGPDAPDDTAFVIRLSPDTKVAVTGSANGDLSRRVRRPGDTVSRTLRIA